MAIRNDLKTRPGFDSRSARIDLPPSGQGSRPAQAPPASDRAGAVRRRLALEENAFEATPAGDRGSARAQLASGGADGWVAPQVPAGAVPRPGVPPLTPEERDRLGSDLPPDGGVQMMWSRNDGYPEPAALAGTQHQRAVEQGLLPRDQQARSADAANRALPGAAVAGFSAEDVASMAKGAGIPLERLDPNQLQQAARLINSATGPQEQRDRIALSLDNLSVAAGGTAPRLSRQDAVNMLWAEGKIPGHALAGLSDAELAASVQEVTRATNAPGDHRLEVGSHRVSLSVGQDGSLLRTETTKPSFLSRVGSAIGDAFSAVGHAIGTVGHVIAVGAEYAGGALLGLTGAALDKVGLGGLLPGVVPSPYPTTPGEVAADQKRIQSDFGAALRNLPPTQRGMLETMRGLGVSDTDILHGSHVVVEDGGNLYDRWRTLPGVRERTSSHYGGGPPQQYEVNFPDIGVVLFGRTPKGETFFQVEAHSNEDIVHHTSDFIQHLLSGHQNVGPAGFSPHSEKEGREIRVTPPPSPSR
ncbi:MAG TPA: hypothetical protein VIG99_18185 [Myxococcaceae bacterium]|jgi:hypothetical protein